MRKILSWLQASRPASQTYILFPLLLGQGFHRQNGGMLNPAILSWICGYSLLIQLFIVYANDYADTEVDRLNTTYNLFSGGSRVLVKGLLSKQEVLTGIVVTMVLNAGVGLVLTLSHGRSWALPLIIISWALLWAYSYAPFRLSYRGGGELLQALAGGLVLPFFGYYAPLLRTSIGAACFLSCRCSLGPHCRRPSPMSLPIEPVISAPSLC